MKNERLRDFVLQNRKRLSRVPVLNRFRYFRYFSLNSIDIEIQKILDFDDGYFVEIGANDGISQSNTLYFENFRNWRGVLIEPHPRLYTSLQRNRGRQSICVNAACVSFLFPKQVVQMIYSDLMTTTLEPFNVLPDATNHALEGSRFFNGYPTTFSAEPKTLTNILEDAEAPSRIDLLSLDVEGSEFEVLLGIDHKKFRFTLICVETSNFRKMNEYLASQDYSFLKQVTHHDYFFIDLGVIPQSYEI